MINKLLKKECTKNQTHNCSGKVAQSSSSVVRRTTAYLYHLTFK
uniref:Uncharacterized protein n=1 Tax=Siphoviridae sp. ctvhu9 TaxID=2827968 RepID=A0A8S5SJX8_9CAUD|nr:MAG TPA: hypothetical protein [Siphoviridae sp. ctvhu9]